MIKIREVNNRIKEFIKSNICTCDFVEMLSFGKECNCIEKVTNEMLNDYLKNKISFFIRQDTSLDNATEKVYNIYVYMLNNIAFQRVVETFYTKDEANIWFEKQVKRAYNNIDILVELKDYK